MKSVVAVVLFVLNFQVFAQSAARLPHQDWTELAAKSARQSNEKRGNAAQDIARPFTYNWYYSVTRWSNYDMQNWFRQLRDDRYLNWSGQQQMKRRLTWLYPQDGCYARANMMVRRMRDLNHPVPYKIFAFGNLWFNTPYAPGGKVGWWYHVAPVVDVDGNLYVLDPSVDFYRPLLVTDWLSRMGDARTIKVAICGPGTYMPNNDCDRMQVRNLGKEPTIGYLGKEWDSLQSLGYLPENLLGDFPPWR